MTLQPDRAELSQFVGALFRYAHPGTFVSLRSFDQIDQTAPAFEISGHEINGSLEPIIRAAEAAANRAANNTQPIVFAPPIATFTNARRSRISDLANGLALSVELDDGDSVAALRRLESILGFATVVVESGSEWIDPETGEITPKIHMHWRLSEPTTEQEDHAKLREARNLAGMLVGADPTGQPVVHPLRWPGSWNRKKAPKMARTSFFHEASEINLDEALERLREAIEASGMTDAPVGTVVSGNPQAPPDLVIAAMGIVTNEDVPYQEWVRLAYATTHAMGGDERAFATFDAWSRKSGKHKDDETVALWHRVNRAVLAGHTPIKAGAGTIFFHAKKAGWSFPQPDAPSSPNDPKWWTNLEQSFVLHQEIANSEEASELPSLPSSPDHVDGLIINPPIHWTAPAPLRQWLIDQWIPIGYVTGLYGDGGVGKSLIAQQLLCSVALRLPWLGLDVTGGRAFGFMCEDDASELHRRQEGINRAYGVDMVHLENLRIAARLGFDNLLMTFDADNRGKPTGIYAEICEYLDKWRPRLVVLDTLADIFGGREIERTHARQFVQGIGGNLARKYDCAVVIPAHPSASGLSTGTGTSGSTAWNNTFRSRLYITRPEGDTDSDTRLISRMKSNYAPKGGEITASWQDGAFGIGGPVRERPEIDWTHIDAIFQEIDRAWKAGDPWSSEPQSKRQSRYIATWASIVLGLDEKKVGRIVQKWVINKFLMMQTISAKNHHRGLRVLRWMQSPSVPDYPNY